MISALHSMHESLVSGMNEVRATLSHVVTRDDFRALHEAQNAEMQCMSKLKQRPFMLALPSFLQISNWLQLVQWSTTTALSSLNNNCELCVLNWGKP